MTIVVEEEAYTELFNCTVGQMTALFYADIGIICSNQPKGLKWYLKSWRDVFEQTRIKTQLKKKRIVVFQPNHITGRHSNGTYTRRMTDEGLSYRTHQKQSVQCLECLSDLTARYLATHRIEQHSKYIDGAAMDAS